MELQEMKNPYLHDLDRLLYYCIYRVTQADAPRYIRYWLLMGEKIEDLRRNQPDTQTAK